MTEAASAPVLPTPSIPKPRLRGVSHQWAFYFSLVAGLILVIVAPGGRATLAAAVYAVSVAALLVLHGTLATVILVVVWAGALGGIVLKLAWIDAPKPLVAVLYVMLGWVAVAALPDLIDGLGVTNAVLVAGGGVLYTVGAVVYTVGRPDPAPRVFGYHEVFHALVIAAATLQYAVIAFFVIPGS